MIDWFMFILVDWLCTLESEVSIIIIIIMWSFSLFIEVLFLFFVSERFPNQISFFLLFLHGFSFSLFLHQVSGKKEVDFPFDRSWNLKKKNTQEFVEVKINAREEILNLLSRTKFLFHFHRLSLTGETEPFHLNSLLSCDHIKLDSWKQRIWILFPIRWDQRVMRVTQ